MSKLGKAILCCLLLLCGCQTSENVYVEGNSLVLGLFVPNGSGVAGVQALTWLSGCKVGVATNQSAHVSRESVSSNDYFGVVHVRESVKTEVSVGQR